MQVSTTNFPQWWEGEDPREKWFDQESEEYEEVNNDGEWMETIPFIQYHVLTGGDPNDSNFLDDYNLEECDCDLEKGTITIPYDEYAQLVRQYQKRKQVKQL